MAIGIQTGQVRYLTLLSQPAGGATVAAEDPGSALPRVHHAYS